MAKGGGEGEGLHYLCLNSKLFLQAIKGRAMLSTDHTPFSAKST